MSAGRSEPMRIVVDIPDEWVAEMVAAKADAGEPFSRRQARRVLRGVADLHLQRWWDQRHHWPIYRRRAAPSAAEQREATIIPVSAWGEACPPMAPTPDPQRQEAD